MRSSMLKILLLAGLLAVFCTGCGDPPPPTPEELYDKGRRRYDEGDLSEAVGYFRQAAEKGHAKAQYKLGLCYYKGIGVEADHKQAVSWWKKAAEQGHPKAQKRLAVCYFTGDGVRMDLPEAVSWYGKSVRKKYNDTKEALEALKVLKSFFETDD